MTREICKNVYLGFHDIIHEIGNPFSWDKMLQNNDFPNIIAVYNDKYIYKGEGYHKKPFERQKDEIYFCYSKEWVKKFNNSLITLHDRFISDFECSSELFFNDETQKLQIKASVKNQYAIFKEECENCDEKIRVMRFNIEEIEKKLQYRNIISISIL